MFSDGPFSRLLFPYFLIQDGEMGFLLLLNPVAPFLKCLKIAELNFPFHSERLPFGTTGKRCFDLLAAPLTQWWTNDF